jgi:hypothetical protein
MALKIMPPASRVTLLTEFCHASVQFKAATIRRQVSRQQAADCDADCDTRKMQRLHRLLLLIMYLAH